MESILNLLNEIFFLLQELLCNIFLLSVQLEQDSLGCAEMAQAELIFTSEFGTMVFRG